MAKNSQLHSVRVAAENLKIVDTLKELVDRGIPITRGQFDEAVRIRGMLGPENEDEWKVENILYMMLVMRHSPEQILLLGNRDILH